MKLLAVASFVTAAAAMAHPAMLQARQLAPPAGLPACALTCFTASIPASSALTCGATVGCYCTLDGFNTAVKTCAPSKCTKPETAKTYQLANSMCGSAKGYTPLTPPA